MDWTEAQESVERMDSPACPVFKAALVHPEFTILASRNRCPARLDRRETSGRPENKVHQVCPANLDAADPSV